MLLIMNIAGGSAAIGVLMNIAGALLSIVTVPMVMVVLRWGEVAVSIVIGAGAI